MTRKAATLSFCLWALLIPAAFGFSSDNSSLTRSFNQTVGLTNFPIVVTATFTNGGTNALRGFYYADELPSAFAVATLSLTLNGQVVTNYTFEAGQDGDVYAGCTPYRWVLEQPPSFTDSNSMPPNATVQIVYSITSSAAGSFSLQQFSWAGYDLVNTNSSFGYSENADQQSVSFLTTITPPSVTGQFSTSGFTLQLDGVPWLSYLIEASTNLYDWVPLVTNTAPFSFTDTNAPGYSLRFYRGRLLLNFFTTATPPSLAARFSSNGFTLQLQGVPGFGYVIEASTNLYDWVPLLTNTAPFSFTDTNAAGYSRRFYRGRLSQ
jgi:hypothetical protein